jgi:hypothetical protein
MDRLTRSSESLSLTPALSTRLQTEKLRVECRRLSETKKMDPKFQLVSYDGGA